MKIKTGITGNLYCFSVSKSDIEDVCKQIGKSINSVYWNNKHGVWAIRVKRPETKKIIKRLFRHI